MSVEGSRTASDRTEKPLTRAAASGSTSRTGAPPERTSTPSISPRAPRKRVTRPSDTADSSGIGLPSARHTDSENTFGAARRSHAAADIATLTMNDLANGDQLMARLSELSEDRWQRFHRPAVPFVEKGDRAGRRRLPFVERCCDVVWASRP